MSKLNSFCLQLQLNRFGNYFCSVESQTLWQSDFNNIYKILRHFVNETSSSSSSTTTILFCQYSNNFFVVVAVFLLLFVYSAFNIMSTWFYLVYLVHLPCFGFDFHDLMWSVLDSVCECGCDCVSMHQVLCSSMHRKIIYIRTATTRYGMEHGKEKTVTRKMMFSLENVWEALSRSFFSLPFSLFGSSLFFFGLVKHCFAFGTSIFRCIFKSMWLCVFSYSFYFIYFALLACLLAWICFFSHTG